MRLNLALQGGGAHGAFAWGVLDRLLEEERLELDAVSGTSAGALNAVALADGLASGGPQAAREKLKSVWTAVSDEAHTDATSFNPLMLGMRQMQAVADATLGRFSGAFSPYEFNPLDLNPLRQILLEQIDFERIARKPAIQLAIAATDVEAGLARIFETPEVTVDTVLASACLPSMHQAVEIDGRFYWDGGFTANPDILTLARISAVEDTLLVLVDQLHHDGLPKTPQEIALATARITFNQPLARDIGLIDAVRRSAGLVLRSSSILERVARQRFHLVEAGHHTARLAPESKLKPDSALLQALHLAGRCEADKWLQANAQHVGWRETSDLAALFLRRDSHAKAYALGA